MCFSSLPSVHGWFLNEVQGAQVNITWGLGWLLACLIFKEIYYRVRSPRNNPIYSFTCLGSNHTCNGAIPLETMKVKWNQPSVKRSQHCQTYSCEGYLNHDLLWRAGSKMLPHTTVKESWANVIALCRKCNLSNSCQFEKQWTLFWNHKRVLYY